MKKLSIIIATVFVFGFSNAAKAVVDVDGETASHNVEVNVSPFAIIDIETTGGSNDITLATDVSGLEAGAEVDFNSVSNSDLWLNYTAVAGQTGGGNGNGNGNSSPLNTRKVTVETDQVIAGLDIKLLVGNDAGNGAGTKGSATGSAVTLSTTAQDIITGIGTAYTGDGANSGHNLTYSLEASDYEALVSASNTITVTYTITEE